MKHAYCLLIDKLLHNQRMWTFSTLQSLAERYGVPWYQSNTDHAVFRHPYGKNLTVSTTRPLKTVHILAFKHLLQQTITPEEPCE